MKRASRRLELDWTNPGAQDVCIATGHDKTGWRCVIRQAILVKKVSPVHD
jgi:hypothetical protein